MQLSIIVPVYNVEKYIDRCLKSLIDQELSCKEYEIICIDDGSLDKSSDIIHDYMEKYPQIKMIHKKNGGLSSARNVGIDAAKGKYLMFVDSDDYIASNTLHNILNTITEKDLDYLGYRMNTVKHGVVGDYFSESLYPTDDIITGTEYLSKYKITISSCGHIAKRSIYLENHLRFTEGVINEDYEFMLKLYTVLSRMSFTDTTVYFYDLKDFGSITSTRTISSTIKSINDWAHTILSLQIWYNEFKSENLVLKTWIHYWIGNFKYRATVNLVKARLDPHLKLQFLLRYRDFGIFIYSVRTLNYKRKLIAFLLKNKYVRKFLSILYK